MKDDPWSKILEEQDESRQGCGWKKGPETGEKKLLSVLFEGAAVPLVVQVLSRGI